MVYQTFWFIKYQHPITTTLLNIFKKNYISPEIKSNTGVKLFELAIHRLLAYTSTRTFIFFFFINKSYWWKIIFIFLFRKGRKSSQPFEKWRDFVEKNMSWDDITFVDIILLFLSKGKNLTSSPLEMDRFGECITWVGIAYRVLWKIILRRAQYNTGFFSRITIYFRFVTLSVYLMILVNKGKSMFFNILNQFCLHYRLALYDVIM